MKSLAIRVRRSFREFGSLVSGQFPTELPRDYAPTSKSTSAAVIGKPERCSKPMNIGLAFDSK